MRPKIAFSKIRDSNNHIDIDKIKFDNPKLWKKLKKQFDIGRKIVHVQLNNGLDNDNENTLRYYLMEFTNRFLQYGPKSFPTSFNALEPFFVFNPHNSILQLHSEEESYGVSLVDFLDYVTDKDFELGNIDFYDNILENIIYQFTFSTGFDEINFSNNGKIFCIGGLSLVRQGNEVSILMQAGESYDQQYAKEYFKKNTRASIEQSLSPSKKALGMYLENEEEPKVVNYKDRHDLWAHNIAALFDLKDKSIDIRFVARDDNISFKTLLSEKTDP